MVIATLFVYESISPTIRRTSMNCFLFGEGRTEAANDETTDRQSRIVEVRVKTCVLEDNRGKSYYSFTLYSSNGVCIIE